MTYPTVVDFLKLRQFLSYVASFQGISFTGAKKDRVLTERVLTVINMTIWFLDIWHWFVREMWDSLEVLPESLSMLEEECNGLLWKFGGQECCEKCVWPSSHRSWRDAVDCLAPHGLLILLSYRTQDHQSRGGTTHSSVVPPHQSLKRMPLQNCM